MLWIALSIYKCSSPTNFSVQGKEGCVNISVDTRLNGISLPLPKLLVMAGLDAKDEPMAPGQ